MINWWYGVVGPHWWAPVLYLAVGGYVSFLAAKFYVHHQVTHRMIALHPALNAFLRTWLWLTTATNVRHWATVHRKNHFETSGENASRWQEPDLRGYLTLSTEYYRVGGRQEDLDRFGRGRNMPGDWLEQHLFGTRPFLGFALLGIIDVLLFGVIGIAVLAIQLIANPIMAASAAGPGLAGPPPSASG